MKRHVTRFVPLVLFILLAVFLWRGLSLDPRALPLARLNKPLPEFHVPVLAKADDFFTPNAMRGRVVLLNVWASWCAACIDEQAFLLELSHRGVPIFGLGYKDEVKAASKWLSEWGNPYQIIGEDFDGKVAIDLGVYGAPETFLIDKAGIIRYRHAGPLTKLVWQKEFLPRMQQWEAKA